MEALPVDLFPVVLQSLDEVPDRVRRQSGDTAPGPLTLGQPILLLSAAVENATDASVVTTVEGQVLNGKPGAQRRYGYAAAEMRRQFDEQCPCRLHERGAHQAEFASIVAHELASPLAAIRYLTGMVMVGGLQSEEQTNALAAICAETEVLQALIADMESAVVSECSDFAVKLQPIAVTELMSEPITFAQTLPGNHPLMERIDTDHRVLADPRRIGQVLRNLIGNASKYSPPRAPIELRTTRSRSRVRIEVADRGPGIQPDDRRRIFEKFERGHAGRGHRGPGLGLGLYLSRRLVQMHGSELTVEPRPGGGSVFGFELEALR